MTQPDHSDRRAPRQRTGSTHPTPSRPGGRRGGDRRPWPTAPTTTRVSPGKPKSDTGRSRSRGSTSTPTPATVWTAGADPIDLDVTWPAVLVERIVTSFSKPAAHVVLLPWPSPNHTRPTLSTVGADGAIDHAPGTESDLELGASVAAVEGLDRTVRVEHVPVDPAATSPASRPFWADLVGSPEWVPATLTTAPATTGGTVAPDEIAGADLIVTSLPPHRSGDHSADLVTLFAARRLRVGGILVVLTHCDWTAGELTDPTGAVVTAGQNADLLYLQHIVALHTPVRDGLLHLAETHPNDHSDNGDLGLAQARACHRAVVRGLPAPHRRVHSDVLVFAQPHNHQPSPAASPSAPTDAVSRPEDLR